MNFVSYSPLRLLTRNEGKIKSYESCTDIRAWSHDIGTRDRYLREWIKSDMPISPIPVCSVIRIIEDMTCGRRNHSRITPRCHRDCKSKILLDSISKSCHAMRECLKENEKFEKFFQEEEFETSHWPCERCLDALKGVKMLWKIIVEKLFNTSIPKEELGTDNFGDADNISDLAKNWEKKIIHQADIVKTLSVHTCKEEISIPKCNESWKKCNRNNTGPRFHEPHTVRTLGDSYRQTSKSNSVKSSTKSRCIRNDYENQFPMKRISKKRSKCILAKCKTVDIGCDSCNFENEQNELNTYKNNLQYLQDQFNIKLKEIDKLKEENEYIKAQLSKVNQNNELRNGLHFELGQIDTQNNNALVVLPQPYEHSEDIDPMEKIDSETIITMKNCKNNDFRHISLLQVLRKSNEPVFDDYFNLDNHSHKKQKEDPIALLNRVHNTFGAMIKREVKIINSDGRQAKKISDINATYQKVNVAKSTFSASTTLSSLSTSSLSNFLSAKETSETENKRHVL